jgi:hypothetical protein
LVHHQMKVKIIHLFDNKCHSSTLSLEYSSGLSRSGILPVQPLLCYFIILHQYAFMAWCLVKAQGTGTILPLPFFIKEVLCSLDCNKWILMKCMLMTLEVDNTKRTLCVCACACTSFFIMFWQNQIVCQCQWVKGMIL